MRTGRGLAHHRELLVSGTHIVLGELVPKSIAIRTADRAALWSGQALRVFHKIFFPVLWALSAITRGLLRLVGRGGPVRDNHHTEREIRILLDELQEQGVMSFRRLLLLENVLDFAGLTVRDVMRGRAAVKHLDIQAPWADTFRIIQESRFTRYPLVDGDSERPVGLLHVKDLVTRGRGDGDIAALVRPILSTSEGASLESLLADMQRRRIHAARVLDAAGRWSGFITLEDVLEEIVGAIRDEFADDDPARLADVITLDGIHLGVEAPSAVSAVGAALGRMSRDALPLPAHEILSAVAARERLMPTYLGHGIGMPHARMARLAKPLVLFVRSHQGIAYEGTAEKVHLLFVILTPAGQPRVHLRLQSTIAALLHEIRYVSEHLRTAASEEEVLEVIRTGEQAALR